VQPVEALLMQQKFLRVRQPARPRFIYLFPRDLIESFSCAAPRVTSVARLLATVSSQAFGLSSGLSSIR
jgi:hypothetical protein